MNKLSDLRLLFIPVAFIFLKTALASEKTSPDIYVAYSAAGVPQFSSHPTHGGYRLYLGAPKQKRPAPRQQEAKLAPLIQSAARRHRLPASLLQAVIAVESDFNAHAVSPKGAVGAMQIMPATAARFGVRDLSKADVNIDTGARYLALLLDQFQGNLPLALAAYNAGERSVGNRRGRLPPYRETMIYVPAVLAKFHAYETSEQ